MFRPVSSSSAYDNIFKRQQKLQVLGMRSHFYNLLAYLFHGAETFLRKFFFLNNFVRKKIKFIFEFKLQYESFVRNFMCVFAMPAYVRV